LIFCYLGKIKFSISLNVLNAKTINCQRHLTFFLLMFLNVSFFHFPQKILYYIFAIFVEDYFVISLFEANIMSLLMLFLSLCSVVLAVADSIIIDLNEGHDIARRGTTRNGCKFVILIV